MQALTTGASLKLTQLRQLLGKEREVASAHMRTTGTGEAESVDLLAMKEVRKEMAEGRRWGFYT